MALIFDPDDLADSATDNSSTPVFINTATKRIKLNKVNALSDDGVTLKALYSFLKEEWKDDPHTKNLPAFPFPMVPITDESFEFVDGWDYQDDAARYLIRTGGWTVRNAGGAVIARWAGIIGLGAIEPDDQLYYYQGAGSAITNVQLQGQINQAVQIYEDINGDGTPDFNYSGSFTIYVREQGQIFGQASLTDIGVTVMDSIAYRFPISTSTDLKINTVDTDIKVTGTGFPADEAPFSGMSITYYATPQSKTGLTGGPYNFGVVIDANSATLQEVYNFVQYALRQSEDINDTTPPIVTGQIASPLLRYVGDTLYTVPAVNPAGGGTGVFIENFDAVDLNSVFFVDSAGSEVSYPFVATMTITFNPNLYGDGAAQYWAYYTTTPDADNWGTADAILVEDAETVPVTWSGNITGPSVTRTYDFDGNTQGGRVPPSAPDVTAVAIGLTTGQYVRATGVIARSKANAIALVAPLERNYANP